MNSIPLIKGNTPQEINTSIIALKKALSELEAQDRLLQGTDKDVQDKIKQINELIEGINTHLGTVDTHLTTIDGQITALQPVDTVTSGNMQSVTSNAVANAINVSPVKNRWVFARLHTANTVVVSFTNQTAHFSRAMLTNVSDNETVIAIFASSDQSIPILVTSRFNGGGFTLWSPVADSNIELQLWGIVLRS